MASDMHKGKCNVCNHPDLEEIEALYMDRVPIKEIAALYDLPHYSLYRHVDYYDLFAERVRKSAETFAEWGSMAEKQVKRDLDEMDPKDRVKFMFDCYAKAAKLAGVEVDRTMEVSEEIEDRSEEELEFMAEHGRWPSSRELDRLRGRDDSDLTVQ